MSVCHREKNNYLSGGSRPSDKGGGGGGQTNPGIRGGGGHPDPEIRGEGPVSKKPFSALRASFWSKNKGVPGPTGPSPGTVTVS